MWKYENFVHVVGRWAWVILILNAVIYILAGLVGLIEYIDLMTAWKLYYPGVPYPYSFNFRYTWYIVGAIFTLPFAYYVIKPKFSDKCDEKDWNYLLNYALKLDNNRIPWMFVFGVIAAIFGAVWGGLPILIPAILLVFAGPKPYDWSN